MSRVLLLLRLSLLCSLPGVLSVPAAAVESTTEPKATTETKAQPPSDSHAEARTETTPTSSDQAKAPAKDQANEPVRKSLESRWSLAETLRQSQRIDKVLAKHWGKLDEEPQPRINDSTFLRRAYLKIGGRIPTYDEYTAFMEDQREDKRARLIDELLASQAYVHHAFTFWADLLRMKSRLPRTGGGPHYMAWMKEAIEENRPYDQIVRDLLLARGYYWEDGATGFYLRDPGMELDHMSMSVQVFLGTRLVCAQCHNHPFDTWTQKQYFEMAAFTYTVEAKIDRNKVPQFQAAQKYLNQQLNKRFPEPGDDSADKKAQDEDSAPDMMGASMMMMGEAPAPTNAQPPAPENAKKAKAQAKKEKRPESKAKREARQRLSRAMREIFTPLDDGVQIKDRKLKLPKDYQYNDAKPNEVVSPAPMFGGHQIALGKNPEETLEAYADWMTSPQNPRFTLVIANRLWALAMGRGLIEPHDNLMEGTQADIPELLDLLCAIMIEVDYDLKQFQRILYNTDLFHRAVTPTEPSIDKPYAFTGPVMVRMTAEQMWDSSLTLCIPDLDERTARSNVDEQMDRAARRVEYLRQASDEDIFKAIEQISTRKAKFVAEQKNLSRLMFEARDKGNREQLKKHRDALNKLRKEYNDFKDTIATVPAPEAEAKDPGETDPRWHDKFHQRLVRASQLDSPEYPGHFLRAWGQSDRNVINNGNRDASIPQILRLLNGPIAERALNQHGLLQQNMKQEKKLQDKLRVLFVSIFTREPTASEMMLMEREVEKNPRNHYKAWRTLSLGFLNTRQFIFVQ